MGPVLLQKETGVCGENLHAMRGRIKLDNTVLTCDQDNFNQITIRSRNRTRVKVVRDTCTITVPLATMLSQISMSLNHLATKTNNRSLFDRFFFIFIHSPLFS